MLRSGKRKPNKRNSKKQFRDLYGDIDIHKDYENFQKDAKEIMNIIGIPWDLSNSIGSNSQNAIPFIASIIGGLK